MNLYKPIFLCGAHKSGSSLLRSLFDGHPDLYAIPFETHYFQNMHLWVDNEYRMERPKNLTKNQLIERFQAWIRHNNTVEDAYSDSISKGRIDIELFQSEFIKSPFPQKNASLITRYFDSIYFAIEKVKPLSNLRYIEKSVENAEFAIDLHYLFPKAKFIHILRNPYANIVALRKFKSNKFGYPIIRRMLRTLYNNYYYLYKNKRIIPDYKIIKYEDLVQNPKEVITDLCDFLNLPFHQTLLQPTQFGNTWKGNSTTNQKFSGIESKHLLKWQKDIHKIETDYINHLFPFILNEFEYEYFSAKGSYWQPVKGESLQRYIANRLYKFYLQEWKLFNYKK